MLPTHIKVVRVPTKQIRKKGLKTETQVFIFLALALSLIFFSAFVLLPEISESRKTPYVPVQTDSLAAQSIGGLPVVSQGKDTGVQEQQQQQQQQHQQQQQQQQQLQQQVRQVPQQPFRQPQPPVPEPAQRGAAGFVGRPVVFDDKAAVSHSTPLSQLRQAHVKKMMQIAWGGYEKYAWGFNELSPVKKAGHSAGIFGTTKMGATIVDALDTLIIMNMTEEVGRARRWIADNLSFDVSAGVSVFEVCIRFMGGLLSAYAMTGDEIYKTKAVDLGSRLMPAFNTKSGIPKAMLNLRTGAMHNWGWASGGCSILSEFGTMQLEFEYLSLISGDPQYAEKTKRVTDYVLKLERPSNGLYPNFLHPETGKWGAKDTSLGALGDSFYEYLLKIWVYHGHRNTEDPRGRESFDEAMLAVSKHLLFRSKPSNLLYVAETKNANVLHKMGHLACFMGGLYALAVKGAPTDELKQHYRDSAAGITETCHEGYRRSATGFGPEMMLFDGANECTSKKANERYYILRPETIEAYFYMWRMTHDQKYREWAWEAVEALEEHSRCGEGYCGIKDVAKNPPQRDDVQQSFFLAETLKYLYLIFSDDNVVSLDEWVFNTEAHPVPIQKL